MNYKTKRAIFWSVRCLGHGRDMLGSPHKDKGFGNWSLIYLLPTKLSAEQPGGRPPSQLCIRECKKAGASCVHHKFKILHSKASQLNICSWMRKSGSPYGGHLARQADQLGAGQPDIRWPIRSQDILRRWWGWDTEPQGRTIFAISWDAPTPKAGLQKTV